MTEPALASRPEDLSCGPEPTTSSMETGSMVSAPAPMFSSAAGASSTAFSLDASSPSSSTPAYLGFTPVTYGDDPNAMVCRAPPSPAAASPSPAAPPAADRAERTSPPPRAGPTPSADGPASGPATGGPGATPGPHSERADAPHSATAGGAARRPNAREGGAQVQRDDAAAAGQRRQRDQTLRKLAVPPAQAARGAARIGREPIFLHTPSRTFSTPRSLDVAFPAPAAKAGPKHPGNKATAETDPATARQAYAAAANRSEALFDRILAAAARIAREADTNLQLLADRNEALLSRALTRLQEDQSQRLLDAAFRRDAALERIATRSDILRYYVVEQANGALGRMGALRRELLNLIGTLRQPVVDAAGTLNGAISAARTAGARARRNLRNLRSHRMTEFRRSGKFRTGDDCGPAMVEAMLEAAVHYAPPRITADIKALQDRWSAVRNFAEPIAACGLCEADSQLATLQGHADNLGVAGPRAIRSARDGALKSIDQTEQQLSLSVLDAHHQTAAGLAQRHDQTRQMLIVQSAQATGGLRRDIERTGQQQLEALDGVAATQPSALGMVRGEVAKAAAANPARAAGIAVQSAERLQRNVASVSERHPVSVLRMAERAQAGRLDRSGAGGRELLAMAESFAQQQRKFIEETYDQVGRSVGDAMFDMAGVPGQVGKSCDSMLAAARKAVGKAKKEVPPKIGFIAQKLTDACDGLVPISPDTPPANPAAGHESAPESLVCTPGDAPNMSMSTPASPLMSIAPSGPATAAAPTPAGSGAAEGGSGGGSPAPAPASCAPCDTARTAARDRATAAARETSADSASGSGRNAPGGGAATTLTRTDGGGAGEDVGVSSDRTNFRSPRAYSEESQPIITKAYKAPRVDAFLGLVKTQVENKIGTQVASARRAILASGETDYPNLMKDALRGLTPIQGRALSEAYGMRFNGASLAADIRSHAYDGFWAGVTSTADLNRDAALAALAGRSDEAAMNELEAAFNFSNETDRIFAIMQSMSQDQMAAFVEAHRTRLTELMEQLSDEERVRFQLLMDRNTVRARSTELRTTVDDINRRHGSGQATDDRGFALGEAIGNAEHAQRWALEGPRDRVDVYGLEDPAEREARERQHWADIQTDFGYLDGVADAIAQADPSAAMSRPDDPPGAALLAYASRPLEVYRVYSPAQREGETREQALARQREEYARWNVALGDERTGEYGTYRSATTSLSEYQHLYLEMVVRHGSQSREARAARTLAEFRRRGGAPPDYKRVEQSLHSGIADAREGGNFEHGSREEADRDRLQTFAMAEQFRRRIEGGAVGPVSGEDARAAFRREMELAYQNRPGELDVALGVIDSDEGNMQAVIDQAIARENPELLTRYLGRMDSNQIQAMVEQWNARHPGGPGLRERLGLFQHHWSIGNMNGAVFTGDEANSLEIAFMGVPQNPQQRAEVAHRVLQQQIDQAGWLGRLMCGDEYDDLVEQARRLRDVMGVRESDIDAEGRVRVRDRDGNLIHMNFDAKGQFHPAPGQTGAGFEMLIAGSRIVADTYANAVDRMATIMTTIIAVIGAIVLTVATFGAGASVLVAMAIAAGFGALTIAVNASMRGGRYSRDDLTRDVVAAAVQIATAGLNVGIARGLAAGGKLIQTGAAASRALTLGERLAVTASRHALATAMITQGAIGGMSNLASTALDPAMRRRDNYGDQVMHSFFRGVAGGVVTAGVAHGLNAGASSLAQRFAVNRAIRAAMAQGASRAEAIERAAEAAVKVSSGRLMEIGVRGFVGATSATAGRATELGYENLVGIRHHGAAEFYAELRHAFIQNAIQGMGEGAALRGSRRVLWSHALEHAEMMNSQRMNAAEAAGRAFDREAARLGIGPAAPATQAGEGARSPAAPDAAARRAADEAHPRARPAANDNEPVAAPARRAVGEGEAVRTARRGADEEAPRLRPEDDGLRLRSADGDDLPASQRKTGEFEAVRPRTLDEHLASDDPRPPPLFVQEDLTPNRLKGGRSIPEHSEFRAADPRSEAASLANYHVLRNADPHREVLLARCVDPANPRFGEFMVFQGGESSVSRPPGGWIAERHSHPRLASGEMAERLTRSLPSGGGGDFAVLRREVDMMAGLVGSTRGIKRESVIDIRLGDTHLETHFSITRNGDSYEYHVTFRPPHDGIDAIGPIYSLADYETAARNLTGQRFGTGKQESYSTADGTTVSAAPARAVHGEPLTATMRQDLEFIAGRMALAGEFEGQMRGGARGEIDPGIGRAATLSDAHARVVRMGLVGERDSMVRLHNIVNDDTIPAPVRAMISDLTLEATRNHLLRTGELQDGEPLVMLFHGATPERTQSLVKEGIAMARGPGGPNDDFGEGLYFTRSFETALQYRDRRSGSAGGGRGGVVPYLLRGSQMGEMVNVSTGGGLRAHWEAFAVANARTLLQGKDALAFTPMVERILRGRVTSFADFDASVHQNRGKLFNDFLDFIGARPSVIFGDLGGPLTHGIQLRQVTDQVVIRAQDVADVLNRQHVRAGTRDADSYRPGRIGAGEEGLSMRAAGIAEAPTTQRAAGRAVDPDIDRRVEQAFVEWHPDGGGGGGRGPIERAPHPPISREGWQLVHETIAGFRTRTDEFGVALNRLMELAPHETGRILRRIAFDSHEGRQLVLTDAHVQAIIAEAVRGGTPPAAARALAMDILTVATPQSPLHSMLSEAPFGAGFEHGLQAHLDTAFTERMAVRVARQYADADSPRLARQGLRRLLDVDTGGVIRAILSPGTTIERARAFYRARRAAGATVIEAFRDMVSLRAALLDPAYGRTGQTWSDRLRNTGMTAADLARLVRRRPDELLHLARTNPAQLAEFFADFVLRQLPGEHFTGPPTAEQFARYVNARQRSNILPVASESASVWANLRRMGLHLLKADAVSRGGANRPGLDIVGFSVPPGRRVSRGDPVEVVIMDDKAYRSTELESVSAMTGDRLATNLRGSANEIEADIRALRNLGEDIVDERIANHIAGAEAAIRQMRRAAAELDAVRPASRDAMREPAYLRQVADILQRNSIVPVVSRQYGNVNALAAWLRAQGFQFDNEYVERLEAEFRRRGVFR